MTDHHSAGATSSKEDVPKAEEFQDFLNEISESGLFLGNGSLFCGHKSIFNEISLYDMKTMDVSVINGKGTASWKLMNPGTIVSRFPIHLKKEENEDSISASKLNFSPWVIILSGGQHISEIKKYEKKVGYCDAYDNYLLDISKIIHEKRRNNVHRETCYGHSESICTDPRELNPKTIELIFKYAFPFIAEDEQKDYVLYMHGTHLMYLLYSMRNLDPTNMEKHKLYIAPKQFQVNIDNSYLCADGEKTRMYFCPLLLGENSIYTNKFYSTNNFFDVAYERSLESFNRELKENFNYDINDCKEFPIDKFISGMCASLTMEAIPTPFIIQSQYHQSPNSMLYARLNFIVTQMLQYTSLKSENLNIPINDRYAAMYLGAVIQLQVSPASYRCFNKPMGKEQLGKYDRKSNWIAEEYSCGRWNIDKYVEEYNDTLSDEEKSEYEFLMSHSSSLMSFFVFADQQHIYNSVMFMNGTEWSDWETNQATYVKKNSAIPTPVKSEKKKDAIKKGKMRAFCEIMRNGKDTSYIELLFLHTNCNVFRFKSNVLYNGLFLLRDTKLDTIKNPESDMYQCAMCKKPMFNEQTGLFCLCYLIYASFTTLSIPSIPEKLIPYNILKTINKYNNVRESNIEKQSDKATYKNTHWLPILDPHNGLTSNGNLRLKHTSQDGFKTGKSEPTPDHDNTEQSKGNNKNNTDDFNNALQLSRITREVDERTGPIFTSRYTIDSKCEITETIASTNRGPIMSCEDIDIKKLIIDELIKTDEVSPFLKTDKPIPPASSVPIFKKECDQKYNDINNYMIHMDMIDDDKRKRKHEDEETTNLFDPPAQKRKKESKKKKPTISSEKYKKLIYSILYHILEHDYFGDGLPNFDKLKEHLNVANIRPEHLKILELQHKKISNKIQEYSTKLLNEILHDVIETYLELIGLAMEKTFDSVSKALHISGSLDDEYDMITLYDNGSNKLKTKAKIVLDIYSTNSIMRKSILMTYYGHLRHQVHFDFITDGTHLDIKSTELRKNGLTKDYGVPAESGQLQTIPSLLKVEKCKDGPPLLTFCNVPGTPQIHIPCISPGVGKVTTEVTERSFKKRSEKHDSNVDMYDKKEADSDNEYGYIPCALLNRDLVNQGISAYKKFEPVEADILIQCLRSKNIKLRQLNSSDFLATAFHDKAVDNISHYFLERNSFKHSGHNSMLPPQQNNIYYDIKRFVSHINAIMEVPNMINDICAKRRFKVRDMAYLESKNQRVLTALETVLKKNKRIAGFLHLYCLISELHGNNISVSHTTSYQCQQERRQEWMKTFTRGFLRLKIYNENPQKQLKWKTFKSFLIQNPTLGSRKSNLFTTLNDISPSHGSYVLANMAYAAYQGYESSKIVYRIMTIGDPFPSKSIYAHLLGLTPGSTGKEIVLGRYALFKNWSAIKDKKLNIDTVINEFTLSNLFDAIEHKTVSLIDLALHYKKMSNIAEVNQDTNNLPTEEEERNKVKKEMFAECFELHRPMIQDQYDEHEYKTKLFPCIWNVIQGKDSLFINGNIDDDNDCLTDEEEEEEEEEKKK